MFSVQPLFRSFSLSKSFVGLALSFSLALCRGSQNQILGSMRSREAERKGRGMVTFQYAALHMYNQFLSYTRTLSLAGSRCAAEQRIFSPQSGYSLDCIQNLAPLFCAMPSCDCTQTASVGARCG